MAKIKPPRNSHSPKNRSRNLECPDGRCQCRKCSPFADWQIEDFFGVASAKRGFDYARGFRVLEYAINDDWSAISGLVQGTTKYDTYVQIKPGGRPNSIIDCRCECPVGSTCKHGAALLYHVLRERTGEDEDDIEVEIAPSELAPPDQEQPAKVHPLIDGWVSDLCKINETVTRKEKLKDSKTLLYLVTTGSAEKPYLRLETIAASKLKAGGYGREERYDLTTGRAGFLDAADRMIGALLGSMRSGYWLDYSFETAEPELIDLLLNSVIKTGRCFWRTKDGLPLTLGDARPGELVWVVDEQGRQRTTVTTHEAQVLLAPSPWYVDEKTGCAGRLTLPFPADLVEPILFGPRLDVEQAKYTRDLLQKRLPDLEIPLPAEQVVIEHREEVPTPVLFLTKFDNGVQKDAAYAFHWVKYGNKRCNPTDSGNHVTINGASRTVVYRRNMKAERELSSMLTEELQLPMANFPRVNDGLCLILPQLRQLTDFIALEIPRLEKLGWDIIYDKSFHDRVVMPDDDDWQGDIVEEEGWFSVDLGINVRGEKVSLLPLLMQAVRSIPYNMSDARAGFEPMDVIDDNFLEAMNQGGRFYVTMADGAKLSLPFPRVKSLIKTLIEVFDESSVNRQGRMPISAGQLVQLLGAEQPIAFQGGDRLRALAASLLKAGNDWPTHAAPNEFGVTLRDYQKQGVAWLQFIASHNIGGILADDMGLGKTVEALAHIQMEYESNHLQRPCLVVCPTSVLPNWIEEAQRMVPHLRVVCLRDYDRFTRQSKLDDVDIVLTSYPLLQRDASLLTLREWHMVILDEAQMIKNRQTQVADVCRRLKANHRICMTGTPVQNHLGELWSQFAFLMPGLLSTHEIFTRVFRTPIEKFNDPYMRAFLAARIRPFLLRRTKSEVGDELPTKTVIHRNITLEGGQRDLYETVRLAMHKRVLEVVEEKGINRSQIVILKALMRLRQVCCDPRLLKLEQARAVGESAKLSVLMEMLTQLVDEGRRVLVFSQFTSMLDLIAEELITREIRYLELRGSTVDRKTPVKQFQAGKAPVFLISLKAGGTGLNLTAADTVIHYDPWWNPAVEEQATDRAHRIGQNKPVFVYRLITTGTVEEKMLKRQDEKRLIADGIYDKGTTPGGVTNHFTERDLKYLLAPIEE